MKISQLTRMVIENLSAGSDKDDTRIFIDTGSVRSEVNRSGARKVGFTVRSPVATASVRGTIVKLSNEYRGAKVETERGVVLAWPTTVSEPVVEEDQPSEETNETAETNGSIADGALSSQSIENAPANSVTITKAQTSGFSSSGNVTSAQVNAYSNTTVESSSTKSVAFSESVASSGNSGAMTMSSSSNSAAATGSLSITAKFED